MARCNSCNGIIIKMHAECYVCGDPVPRAARRARRSKPESKPKKSNSSHGWFFLGVSGLSLLAIPSKAFGYADPGTGAFIYQVAYAAFLGGIFYIRQLLNRRWRKQVPTSEPISSLAYDRSAASARTLRVKTRLN